MIKHKFEKWNVFMVYDDEDKRKWHRIAIPIGTGTNRTDIIPMGIITDGYEYKTDAVVIFTDNDIRSAYQHGRLIAIIQK